MDEHERAGDGSRVLGAASNQGEMGNFVRSPPVL